MGGNFDPRTHIGETHGVYTIVDVLKEKDKYGHYIYKGVCNECGYEKCSHYGEFSGAKSATTVCKHKDARGEYIKRTQWSNQRLAKIFKGMKSRCYNKNEKTYRWYGGKGIKICNEWLNDPILFEKWALCNGYSDDLTIDRIDEDKDYCPENCRWITVENNSKYKSTTSMIDVDGTAYSGTDWAKKMGLGANRINTYVRRYGEKNTIEFIRKYLSDPGHIPKGQQSYYDLYMNNLFLKS